MSTNIGIRGCFSGGVRPDTPPPLAAWLDGDVRPHPLIFAFSHEIVTSQRVIFSLRVTYPDPSTRGAFRRRSVGGERERHLRAGGRRNLRPPAVLGQPPRPLGARPGRPRSKAQRP